MPSVGLWHWPWWHPVRAVLLSPVVMSPPHCGYHKPWDWCHPCLCHQGPQALWPLAGLVAVPTVTPGW